MSLVMREWYGIFWHFLFVFTAGVLVGWLYLGSADQAAIEAISPAMGTNVSQPTALVTDQASHEFMQNWCAVNFGTGE